MLQRQDRQLDVAFFSINSMVTFKVSEELDLNPLSVFEISAPSVPHNYIFRINKPLILEVFLLVLNLIRIMYFS